MKKLCLFSLLNILLSAAHSQVAHDSREDSIRFVCETINKNMTESVYKHNTIDNYLEVADLLIEKFVVDENYIDNHCLTSIRLYPYYVENYIYIVSGYKNNRDYIDDLENKVITIMDKYYKSSLNQKYSPIGLGKASNIIYSLNLVQSKIEDYKLVNDSYISLACDITFVYGLIIKPLVGFTIQGNTINIGPKITIYDSYFEAEPNFGTGNRPYYVLEHTNDIGIFANYTPNIRLLKRDQVLFRPILCYSYNKSQTIADITHNDLVADSSIVLQTTLKEFVHQISFGVNLTAPLSIYNMNKFALTFCGTFSYIFGRSESIPETNPYNYEGEILTGGYTGGQFLSLGITYKLNGRY